MKEDYSLPGLLCVWKLTVINSDQWNKIVIENQKCKKHFSFKEFLNKSKKSLFTSD